MFGLLLIMLFLFIVEYCYLFTCKCIICTLQYDIGYKCFNLYYIIIHLSCYLSYKQKISIYYV